MNSYDIPFRKWGWFLLNMIPHYKITWLMNDGKLANRTFSTKMLTSAKIYSLELKFFNAILFQCWCATIVESFMYITGILTKLLNVPFFLGADFLIIRIYRGLPLRGCNFRLPPPQNTHHRFL